MTPAYLAAAAIAFTLRHSPAADVAAHELIERCQA